MFEGYDQDEVYRIETNLDDVTGEVLGTVQQRLLELGALDVWCTAIQMKKSRPGVMLSLLCAHADTERMVDLIFRETSAFGLRIEPVRRVKLHRSWITVSTQFGDIRVKLGERGGTFLQIAPEHSSCVEAAVRADVPLRRVYDAAQEAARKQTETARCDVTD
jgi:uncharacterized protein (DUF111 family)